MDTNSRQLLQRALRLQKPGSGSSLQFLTTRTAMFAWPDLSSGLGDIPWAVIGAVATRHYMPERVTADLKVLIRGGDAPESRRRLDRAGCSCLQDLPIPGSAWEWPSGVRIEVLEATDSWLDDHIEAAVTNRDLQGLPILPLPALVVLKLRSARLQDIADTSRMLGQASDEQLEAVRNLVRQHQPQDLEDLETMIALGRRELER